MQFRFDYAAVLEHRRNMEDIAQQDLAKLLRERMVLEGQVRDLAATVRVDPRAATEALVGVLDIGTLQVRAKYASHAAVRRDQIIDRIRSIERRIDETRARLADAAKRRRAVE